MSVKRNRGLRRVSLTAVFVLLGSVCRAQPPLVYDVENTGANFAPPPMPSFADLPVVRPLTDPFAFADGSRDTSFTSWERRRNEIKAYIEKYEIGPKPDASGLVINAVYTPGSPGVLEVHILRTSNGQSLTLTSPVNLPSGTPPPAGWPAVIGMSLVPSSAPTSAAIAKIDFMHDDVTQYAAGQQVTHAADPYFRMYPEYNAGPCPAAPAPCGAQVGQYSAWSWGVSRLIDGIIIATHQAVNPLPIDVKHLGVNGCSYAGKMALYAGAFDERIAATFAQESGGGGDTSWRASNTLEPEGTVEKTNNTDGSWFSQEMKNTFGYDDVYKLPDDHHELEAMVAPRALLVSANTDFTWLSNRSAYVTSKATQRIYETFGIGDRYGFWIDGNHGHCALGANEQPMIDAFYGKFLLGQDTGWDTHLFPQTDAFADASLTDATQPGLDRSPAAWTAWWGSGVPAFPDDPVVSLSSASVEPNKPVGTAVGTLSTTNPDGTPRSGNTYSLVPGPGSADNASFTMDGGTLRTAAVFDYATKSTYHIRVRSNNGPTLRQALETPLTIAVRPPPTANAGANRTVEAFSAVTLDGSGSADSDGDTLTYQWTLTQKPAGSAATLSDATAVRPSFTPDALGNYVATLVVSDGSVASAPATVTIAVVDTTPPVIDSVSASPNVLTARKGTLVPVTIACSAHDNADSAPAGHIVGVACDQTVAPGDVVITGALTVTLKCTSTQGPARNYYVLVGCRDASGNEAPPKQVNVTARPR